MKVFKLLIVFVIVSMVTACSPWPKIYVGDTSGIITYDRLNHKLEILWDRHVKAEGHAADSVYVK